MKRLSQALVMLCVFSFVYMIQVNHNFNVKAESCDGPLQIVVPHEEINIEINGEEPDYKEGVTVLDSCGNDVTALASLTVDNHFVNLDIVGDYRVVLTAFDGIDVVVQKMITIHVKTDIIPPDLSGYYEKYFFLQGDELDENDFLENVTAIDDKDLDITSNIIVDYSDIEMSTPGQYEVIFEVSDSSDNKTIKNIAVVVLDVLLIIDTSSLTHEVYDALPDFLSFGSYILDGEEVHITVDDASVNPDKVGRYEIIYTASLYNLIEMKTEVVDVVDRTPPEITGISKVEIKEGLYFNPYKYLSVQDNYDDVDDITVKVSGNYSTKVPGKYSLTAVATDKSGNQSDFTLELTVLKEENHIVLWTTVILGVVIVGACGALYYIRKKREY